jgi:two-component system sensor histidine kinase/response regulator
LAAAPKLTETGSSSQASATLPSATEAADSPVPEESAGRLTRSVSIDRLRLLRFGAIPLVLFEVAYAVEHSLSSPAGFSATAGLHLFNIAVGICAYAATFTQLVRRFWREACVAVCAGLMMSTTKIGIDTGTFEPLFVSIVALVVAIGTLAQWEAGWQAPIGWIGIACFYVLEWQRPNLDPHPFMHWLGLFTIVALAQANTRLQKNHRRLIEEKIAALEAHHRELRHQMTAGESLARERESALHRLAEREAALQEIFDSALDVIAVTRYSDGSYLRVNAQFSVVTGYSAEEVLGTPASQTGFWMDIESRAEFLRRLEQDGCVKNLERSFKIKSGRVVPFLLNAVPIEIDGERCILTTSREISDLQESQRRLRESEATLRKILESSPDAVCIYDARGRYVHVNQEFVRLTGFSREECIGKTFWELGVWPDRESADRLRAAVVKSEVRNWQATFRARDGRPIPSLISAVMVDLEGQQCCLTISRDISDLKSTELKLQESEASLRKIFDSVVDPLTVTDMAGVYLDVNAAFVELTGYSRAEVIGKTVWQIPLVDWDNVDSSGLLELINKGVTRNSEALMRTKNGGAVPVLISTVLMDLNGQKCGLTIARDISERKQQELKLQQSEEYFRTLIESSSDVILVFDRSGNIVFAGGAGRADFGYSNADIIGTSGMTLVHPDDVMQQAEITRDAFQNPGKVMRSEARIRAADGRWVECEFVGRATIDPSGNPILLSTMRDVSERKRVETELARARDQALAASKAKSEFLSSMSHEIRTPMNAILGMADLMSETELTAEQRRCLETVIGNGTALLELINNILDLAKVDSGRLNLESLEFDLVELTEKVADMLAVRAHEKGLELMVRCAPDLPSVLIGDPLRIRQVLTNLIGNAIKFTDQGQVLIDVERNAGADAPGSLNFSVRDSGIGIEEEKLATIFSAFTQADSSTTRRYGGSGLGLAIVERLVTQMGGQVRAESTVGKGSLFSFTVELAVPEASSLATRAIADPNLDGMRALVVDDNATNRAIAREMLEAKGALVSEADSGAEGLRAFDDATLAHKPFDLLVVDSQMPTMDGLEMVSRIGQHDRDASQVIIMVDSTALNSSLALLKERGVVNYIVKPLKQREFYSQLLDAFAPDSIPRSAPNPHAGDPLGSRHNDIAARPMRILLADDSPDNRLLIRAYLKNTPYTLDEADNGRMALAKFIEGKYDLVLMDIQMPALDGYTVVRMIRDWEKHHQRKRTPIVALTASVLDDAVRRAREAGCDMHLSKPVKKTILLEAIANSIESAEAVVI